MRERLARDFGGFDGDEGDDGFAVAGDGDELAAEGAIDEAGKAGLGSL